MKLQFLSSARFNLLTSPELRPSAQAMASSLRNLGVNITPELEATIAGEPRRLNALHQLDFKGEKTAFQHIEDLARAGTLVDGKPAAPVAASLFELAGSARASNYTVAKCFARVSQATYSLNHAGEFNRIIGNLAGKGNVTLADGTTLTWNPATLRIRLDHISDLWGAVNHITKEKVLPRNGELSEAMDYAYRGDMANITTRLMGEQFVNVAGREAMPHINEIVDGYGPMFAEFSNHGGAVQEVQPPRPGTTAPILMALEEGGATYDRSNSLGYVVVPAKEVAERGLTELTYPDDDGHGYFRLGNG